jgi:nucleoside-diphosphate-sugar epimerase
MEPRLMPVISRDRQHDVLIGSGFVGRNLLRDRAFGSVFNSANIDDIRHGKFDTVVCAAPGAEKWKANLEPLVDRASVERLWDALRTVDARKVVLISTVDVYPVPVDVDEEDEIDASTCQPYGRHRLELEHRVRDNFYSLVIRLPALFGADLRKNALYDLLHDHEVDRIDSRGIFQFYDIRWLANDLKTADDAGLTLLNVATEPMPIAEVASQLFGKTLSNRPESAPPRYDFHTRHADLFGGSGNYLRSASEVLVAMRDWVHTERGETA